MTVFEVFLASRADWSDPSGNFQHRYSGAVSVRSFVYPKVVIRHRTGAKPIVALRVSWIQILDMRHGQPRDGGRAGTEGTGTVYGLNADRHLAPGARPRSKPGVLDAWRHPELGVKASELELTPGGNLVFHSPEYCVPGASITGAQAGITIADAIVIHFPTVRGMADDLIIEPP